MAMDLGKQVGPMPLGAWLVLAVGGIGLATFRKKTAPAAKPYVPIAADSIGTGPGWTAVVPPSAGPISPSSAITTNGAWGIAAITFLIAHGIQPTMADAAVRNYLAGQPLDAQAQAIIDTALKEFGPPPESLGAPNTNPVATPVPLPSPRPVVPGPAPAPTPTPVAAPPPPPPVSTPGTTARWIVVTPWPNTQLDSLWAIARTMYGNGALWPRIYNANRSGVRRPDGSLGMVANPAVIQPGWKLVIP